MNQNENRTFSKRFMFLLQKSIKCKCSILINCLKEYSFSKEFQYLFTEIFLLENDITMIDVDNKFKVKKDYNKTMDLQITLELLKEIKSKLDLQNFIYEKFLSKFYLFIYPIVYSFLVNYSQNSNPKLLQNILQLLKKYNITFTNSFDKLLKCCENDLFNISKEFFEYSVITMKDKLHKDYNNNYYQYYSKISDIIETVMYRYNKYERKYFLRNFKYDKDFYEKLHYLMDLFLTEKWRIKYLTENVIYEKLVNLLNCEEDSSKEIYDLFNNLHFFKYKDIKLPLGFSKYFSLQFNLENFKYLINLNLISKSTLLKIFHESFISENSFDLCYDKEFTKNQIKLYLNYFINELNFDIYSKDNFGSNIIFRALCNCNFYTIIKPIKECCNLQHIDYSKMTTKDLYDDENILQKQLSGKRKFLWSPSFVDEKLYEINELKEIKLNSMKEILEINEINHLHLLYLDLENFNRQYLSTLKYLFLNIKLKKDRSVTFIEYLFKILENDEIRNELEKSCNSEIFAMAIKIGIGYIRRFVSDDSDLIIYIIYKKFYSYLKEFCIFENKNYLL